jgi:hypothetical protein
MSQAEGPRRVLRVERDGAGVDRVRERAPLRRRPVEAIRRAVDGGGTTNYPGSLDGSLCAAGGNTPGSGQVAHDQAFYGDGNPWVCTSDRLNGSNGGTTVW